MATHTPGYMHLLELLRQVQLLCGLSQKLLFTCTKLPNHFINNSGENHLQGRFVKGRGQLLGVKPYHSRKTRWNRLSLSNTKPEHLAEKGFL